MKVTIGKAELSLTQGDITREDSDAIVNAANSSLRGGGGVDGAIHRAGGPAILQECIKIGGCPTGEAVITTGGTLKARHVIHTVGPIWRGGDSHEEEKLASCYRNSLALALHNGIRTISFPSISTGAYGYPLALAAPVAIRTVVDFIQKNPGFTRVNFVLFDGNTFRAYEKAVQENAPGA